jgi:FimV-like protein
MEAELDRIEGEELAARDRERAARQAAAGVLPADGAGGAVVPEGGSGASASEVDAAGTGDEPVDLAADDPFGRRAAAQAKLEQVMALRASGDLVKARQLLYEVLVEGSEDQVFVARNILGQLDQPG